MYSIQPSSLTNDELARYAQMFHDKKESLPMVWQEELLKRMQAISDELYATENASSELFN